MSTDAAPGLISSTELMLRPQQRLELVKGVSWLGKLEDKELTPLLEETAIRALQTHEWLFRQDAPAKWLYIMIRGTVRLTRSTGDGRLAIIRCVERGGTLGELSMVSSAGVYLYSAEALCRTQVLTIPAARCREIMDRQPACRAAFLSHLAHELTERLEDLALLSQTDAMSRLISYILHQLHPDRNGGPRIVRLTYPKRWLAAQLAITPETLSRLLGKLRDSGVISIERQRLVVLDEQKLREQRIPVK